MSSSSTSSGAIQDAVDLESGSESSDTDQLQTPVTAEAVLLHKRKVFKVVCEIPHTHT